MAAGTIKTKGQLTTDIDSIIVAGGNIDALDLNGILQNIVASYEDVIRDYTTVQRDALTPVESQVIYNTDNKRLEVYTGSQWMPTTNKPTMPLDCSANPNYPTGLLGEQIAVTVAGKIGGGSGEDVYVGDLVTCIAANSGGTQASVGSSWKITQSASSTDSPTYYTEVTLSSAQLLALFTTPQTLVAAAGAGKMILPVQIVSILTFNSVAYATNTNLIPLWDDNTSMDVILDLSAGNNMMQVSPVSFSHEFYDNIALRVTTQTGNPTAGDSVVKVKVWYKIITL